jgi:hypothetical protein
MQSVEKLTDVSEEHFVSVFRVEKAEQETRVKEGGKQSYFSAGFLFGLFFDPEDGGEIFLRNVD